MTFISTIAIVSAETGIAKEVLRKWETRYGFPVPVRDDSGNRVYTDDQVARLKLIKKLLDDGMRPGQVVPLEEPALRELAEQRQPVLAVPADFSAGHQVVGWMQTRNPAQIRENLRNELLEKGLRSFITELMPAMNQGIGDAWERGDIAVRDEHLYSEIVQGLVREAVAPIVQPAAQPRILLTTLPGEAHTLGILMLEALMSIEGAFCISLGPQSPLNELVSAASDFQADIVALSFSVAFPKKKIAPLLKEVRVQLPGHIQLWSGGAGVAGLDRTPRGVTILSNFGEATAALEKYRKQQKSGK